MVHVPSRPVPSRSILDPATVYPFFVSGDLLYGDIEKPRPSKSDSGSILVLVLHCCMHLFKYPRPALSVIRLLDILLVSSESGRCIYTRLSVFGGSVVGKSRKSKVRRIDACD